MERNLIYQHTFKIEDWMIRENGSLLLLEREIMREKQVKIYVNSKELTHHNRPHVHAFYGDKEYSIAIDSNPDLLAPDREDKFYRFIVKTMFRDELIQKCRQAWNDYTDSKMKFVKANNLYLPDYKSVI